MTSKKEEKDPESRTHCCPICTRYQCAFEESEKRRRHAWWNTSPIDDVRGVQNTSSGSTGYAIADDLYRYGHDVTCVVGRTSVEQPSWLPLCIKAEQPDEMLAELKALSNDEIHAWVHTAAVLDYVVEAPAEGKLASQQGPLKVQLVEGAKHIQELKEKVRGSTRIGFKLETGIKQRDLIHRATAQIEHSEMTAVVANRLEDLGDSSKPRGYLVDKQGSHFVLETQYDLAMPYGQSLNEAIEVRRFAIVGHRAMSKGKLPLNDLAGGAGRMDVLIRAVMSSLLTHMDFETMSKSSCIFKVDQGRTED